jgi:phospholipid/cholesterol/gamma-HCH transport system substrate-binding protein
MSESRLATKVGLFVLVFLAALAALLISFSKSGDWFKPTYHILLRTSNVSGIKARAAVLMAGVPVGYVETIELAPDNKSVIMTVRVFQQYMIRKNSIFAIEQSGFLGDQYVAITPQSNQGAFLEYGEMVRCLPPFDLQDTARRASDLLSSVGDTLGNLKQHQLFAAQPQQSDQLRHQHPGFAPERPDRDRTGSRPCAAGADELSGAV